MTDKDTLIAEAVIGDEAKNFIESDLGKTILGMIEQDIALATAKYREVDPTDSKTVRDIQNEVWRAETFKSYLLQLFQRGEQAIHVFAQQRDT